MIIFVTNHQCPRN